MTLPAFDHEYWRTPREDWTHLGYHWHCYSWTGDGRMIANDAARRDPATELPPTVIREWLGKADRIIRKSPRTPDDAVAWLRREYERAVPQLGAQALDIPDEMRFGRALHDLQCGNDISWGFWLTGGSSYVSMAVVATAECRLH
ncbi:hypothetical protein [Actinomadura alba]|uniref:Uncharacterized protein n=1 Tax=Actinomadura alba TaxID=406431 RepID=A0ABR7LMR9_9ACTN|nr:hypothetical protein [Actinomadura alba]MBC6466116.1 hypothetical protein [Actinomadura alba]